MKFQLRFKIHTSPKIDTLAKRYKAPINAPMIMQYFYLAYHSSQFSILKSEIFQQILKCLLDIGKHNLGQFDQSQLSVNHRSTISQRGSHVNYSSNNSYQRSVFTQTFSTNNLTIYSNLVTIQRSDRLRS